jgi:hypothetical protein
LSHVGAHTSFGRAGGLALGAHTQAHAYTHTHTHTIQKLSSGSIRCLVTHTIPLSHVGVTYTNFGRVGGLTLGAHAQAHTHTHTGDTNLSSGSITHHTFESRMESLTQALIGRTRGRELAF